MSDTKALNNQRDALGLDLRRARERITALTTERNQHQRDACEQAALARQRGAQLDGIGDDLRRRLASAVLASTDDPGRADLAAAVREARAALDSFNTITGRTE